MTLLRGLAVLMLTALFFSSTAHAENPFKPFVGSGGASGKIWLVGKAGADSTRCTRRANAVGESRMHFTLSCSGGRSFSLSCSFRATGARVRGNCSVSIASLSGGGTISGKAMSLSMKSSLGSHSRMTITPSSLSFRSPDARYVKSLQISGL